MFSRLVLTVPLLALAAASGRTYAQTADGQKFYKLEFVVKEVEGTKVLNARSYSMILTTDSKDSATTRGTSRIPIPKEENSSSFIYIEIGVTIECRGLKELARGLSLNVNAEITAAAQAEPGAQAPLGPVLRSTRWSSGAVIVPVKKPTVIFSSDDPSTKRQMQLELTATPIL
jgi:hypothetical protein